MLSAIINIFSAGIADCLSAFIPLSLLLDSYPVLRQTGFILASNAALVCGIILIYYKGLGPLNRIIYASTVDTPLSEHVTYMIMHAVWLLPICIYCHTSAFAKYQTLADRVLSHIYKGKKEDITLIHYISSSSYGFVAWLTVFLQVQFFSAILPALINLLIGPFKRFTSIPILIDTTLTLCDVIASVLSCALYAWYCFDFRWIAEGLDPDVRFTLIETHWPYFLGFGLPFVVLNKWASGFVSYGVFMAYYPMAIMIATTASFEKHTKVQAASIPVFPVFRSTQLLAHAFLRHLEGKKAGVVLAENADKSAAAKKKAE